MNWTKAHLKNLTGKVKSIHVPPVPKNKVRIPESIGPDKLHLIAILEGSGFAFVPEFRFDLKRKFRFDWAIPDLMVAVEYEGIFSEKSGHTTLSGYTKDVTKYNLATKRGWKVLRYTADNYLEFQNDLNEISQN